MNCLAIWYKHKRSKPKEELGIDLHLNLWELDRKNRREGRRRKVFLDIGIMIENPGNVANINIFTPFKVEEDEIEDLGHCFEDDKLVAAVFNAPYNVTTSAQSKTLTVKDNEGNLKFYIYRIDVKNDIRKPPKSYEGSVFSIKISTGEDVKPIYYRIRINSNKLEELYTRYKPESHWLQSHYYRTELIDFRINERRNLDRSLLEEMQNSGEVYFKSVEYFVMRESRYDYVSSQTEMHRSRKLEEDLWGSYVGGDCECRDIIAYHWSPPDARGFNAFVKYRIFTSDIITRIKFCLFLGLVGLIGGILAITLMKIIMDYWWR